MKTKLARTTHEKDEKENKKEMTDGGDDCNSLSAPDLTPLVAAFSGPCNSASVVGKKGGDE